MNILLKSVFYFVVTSGKINEEELYMHVTPSEIFIAYETQVRFTPLKKYGENLVHFVGNSSLNWIPECVIW